MRIFRRKSVEGVVGVDILRGSTYSVHTVSDRKKEISNISHPWEPNKGTSTGIRCPVCGNDGMDGSIHGRGGQWSVDRTCMKSNSETGKPCGTKFSGGIGVQKADFSQPLPILGEDRIIDDPVKNDVHQPFRDPSKNRDPFEE